MRLTRDENVCQACGDCARSAPDLFELNPGDYVVTVRHEILAPHEEAAAEHAVGACPSGALAIQ